MTKRCPQCHSPQPHHKMSCSDPSNAARGMRIRLGMHEVAASEVIDTFLGIHPDDQSCHGPALCMGCVLSTEVRRLRAVNADLQIDVKMHEREHQRVERARDLVKKWRENVRDDWGIQNECADELEAALQND